MFTVNVILWLLILVIHLEDKGIYARPPLETETRCPSTGIPQGSRRGINVIHGTNPVFKIDIGELEKDGYIPGTQYEVKIKAQDPNNKFGNVLLWVQTESEKCKTGILDTTKGRYHQPTNCTHMVLKDTRRAAYNFAFKWNAPECGCVLIRARVESADKSVLFLEDETVTDGYLTKKVCPKQDPIVLKQMSQEEKRQLLCDVVKTAKTEDIVKRSYVQTRRKVQYDKMPQIEKEAWYMVFDQKIFEVQQCCNMVQTKQEECLSDVRRHRIDRFCAYGESVVPFTVKRRAYMIEREQECCWRLGEGRYQCFASGPMKDGTGSHFETLENMDESNPVNDLEDFVTELGAKNKPKSLRKNVKSLEKKARRKDDNDDDADDDVFDSSIEKSDSFSIESPKQFEEKKEKGLSTPSVLFTTETSKVLQKKLQRTKTKLECCNLGKQYGSTFVSGDAWDRCEAEAHTKAKSYQTGKRRCKNFFMRCCVEYSSRSKLGNQREELSEELSQDIETDELEENKQHSQKNVKDQAMIDENDEVEDSLLDDINDDDTKITKSTKNRKNRENRKRKRKNRKKKSRKSKSKM